MNENVVESIYNKMVESITNGQWAAGSKIPTENELAKTYPVSYTHLAFSLKTLPGSKENIFCVCAYTYVLFHHLPLVQPCYQLYGFYNKLIPFSYFLFYITYLPVVESLLAFYAKLPLIH